MKTRARATTTVLVLGLAACSGGGSTAPQVPTAQITKVNARDVARLTLGTFFGIADTAVRLYPETIPRTFNHGRIGFAVAALAIVVSCVLGWVRRDDLTKQYSEATAKLPLQVADGVVEEPGFLLFADVLSYEDTPHRLRLLVRDPCGRTAEAVHLMADGQGRVDLGFVPGGSDAGLPDAVAPDAAAGQRDAMP